MTDEGTYATGRQQVAFGTLSGQCVIWALPKATARILSLLSGQCWIKVREEDAHSLMAHTRYVSHRNTYTR